MHASEWVYRMLKIKMDCNCKDQDNERVVFNSHLTQFKMTYSLLAIQYNGFCKINKKTLNTLNKYKLKQI